MAAKKKATTKKACGGKVMKKKAGGKVQRYAEGGNTRDKVIEHQKNVIRTAVNAVFGGFPDTAQGTMEFESSGTGIGDNINYRDYGSFNDYTDALNAASRQSYASGENRDYFIQAGMGGTLSAAKKHFGISGDSGQRSAMYTPVSEAGTNPGYEEQYGGGRRPRANVPDSGSSSFWEQHNQLSGNTPSSSTPTPTPTSDSGTRTIVTPGSGSQDNRTPTGTTSRMSPDIEVKPVTSARYYKDGGYVTNDVNGCMNGSCDHPSRIKTLHRKS